MNLILTFDYELFGDGSGNVFTHMIEPMDEILRTCDLYNIKTTIFFEVIEYIRLKEEWETGNSMGYSQNPVKAIETQIQDAAQKGHDIQLHIHPQWFNAKYLDGKWKLDMRNWRLGSFQTKTGYTIEDLVHDGKNKLENLIFPVLPEYKCIALRAGAFNIMPSSEVYLAMKKVGLKCDSSVYPGGFENDLLSKFDYRKVPVNLDYWWANEKDIRNISYKDKEILEIPIFALPITRWKKLITFSKLKSILIPKNKAISSVSRRKIKTTTLNEKIKYLMNKESYTWDMCMFSKSLHKEFFRYIERNFKGESKDFVLIGHPKSLQNKKIFSSFLKLAHNREQKYLFKTLKQKYEEINQ